MIVLSYERGSILARGGQIPFGTFDARADIYRSPALRYREVVEDLDRRGVAYRDEVLEAPPSERLRAGPELRDYQGRALEAWRAAGRRGVVILPTGAGKTFVALKAIEEVGSAALVVAPTLVLVEQWRQRLEEAFGVEVGLVGGGKEAVRFLTVATYASASLRAEQLGNRFRLLVLDEVHHLPAPSYLRIGKMYAAPFRLGLTATLGREGGGESILDEVVGRVVYEMGVDDLAGVHLSDYSIQTVHAPLTEAEQAEYDAQFAVYHGFLRRRGIRMRSARDFQRFILRSGRDPEARRALLARNRAMEVALNSAAKIGLLRRLLAENRDERVIVFTQHNSLVYQISREMLIPAITHQTPRDERNEILERFRSGRYRRVVTSRVLDEGVDIPDASMAVILSGTGSSREFIQRLGRVLRKRSGKHAKLVEIVSKGTAEVRLSRRRKGA